MTNKNTTHLQTYISHPSVSADPSYAEGMLGARDFISNFLSSVGLTVEVVETPKHPIVLAKREGKSEWPHILLYGHYDVQPADPFDLWETPPFEAVEREGRIYGRGVTDNKGPQLAMLLGLKRALEENPDLPLRITVLIEGEEEIGSPSFRKFLEEYKERLKADVIILSDTVSPKPDHIMVTSGLRGITGLEVTLTGPKQDLHSGMNGGGIMNPIRALAKVCASLHDDDGKVNIPGFYDDVRMPADWEREELKKYPSSEEDLKKLTGVPAFAAPKGYTVLESLRFLPTLEFNGIGGGYQGAGDKTIIPSKAFVKITCRLVPDQKPDEIRSLVEKAIRERCPEGVTIDIRLSEGGAAYGVTPPGRGEGSLDEKTFAGKAFKVCEETLKRITGHKPLFLREGGSIPIMSQFKEKLGLNILMIGLSMPEDGMHAPNESMAVECFERGIAIYEDLFRNLVKD